MINCVFIYFRKSVKMIYMFVACCGWHIQQQKRRGLKGMESLDSDSEQGSIFIQFYLRKSGGTFSTSSLESHLKSLTTHKTQNKSCCPFMLVYSRWGRLHQPLFAIHLLAFLCITELLFMITSQRFRNMKDKEPHILILWQPGLMS